MGLSDMLINCSDLLLLYSKGMQSDCAKDSCPIPCIEDGALQNVVTGCHLIAASSQCCPYTFSRAHAELKFASNCIGDGGLQTVTYTL